MSGSLADPSSIAYREEVWGAVHSDNLESPSLEVYPGEGGQHQKYEDDWSKKFLIFLQPKKGKGFGDSDI